MKSLAFDRSARGKVSVSGPDAAVFLNNISTNDCVDLAVGSSRETFFCDHRARVLFYANAWRRQQNEYLLDVDPGYGAKLLAHLDRYLISEAVELADVTNDYSLFHVLGTRPPGEVREASPLGKLGYDLLLPAGESIMGVPAGDDDLFETMRIEAGTPVYGLDMDENRFVMEVPNAARAVCYTKGCFIGQEPIVMSRDRAGQVNRLFLGLRVLDGGPVPHATKLTKDGAEVGVVTSCTLSPRLQAPLALAYLRRPHVERGLIVNAGEQRLEVLGYPPLAD